MDTILSNPELLGKTLEVVNGVLSGKQQLALNPPPPTQTLPPNLSVEPSNEGSTLFKNGETKEVQKNVSEEEDMFKSIIKNQINNVLQKLAIIKEGIKNKEFENIAVAVDYVFAPAEIDMFIGYMEQFNINTADDLISTLNQFGINLENEINQIGKELLNDVIQYLNGEEIEEAKNE